MVPTRRALLASLGAAFAGCSADPDRSPTATTSETPSQTDSPSSTDTASPTPEPDSPERIALDDDRVRWRVDLPTEQIVGQTVAGDSLVVGTNNQSGMTPSPDEPDATGGFAALSLPDGEIRHYRELDAPVTDGPVVHDGDPFVVVGYSTGYDGRDQRLQRLSPSGEVRWESPARDAWLSVYDFDADTAYLGTGDDGLAPTGETTFAVGLGQGDERWATEGGDAGRGRVDGETLYAGYAGPVLAALETGDGTERWRRTAEPLHTRESSVPEAGGNLFARVEQDGTHSLAALDPADGSTGWEQSNTYATSATPVGDAVVVTDYDGGLIAYGAASGDERWSRQFDETPSSPILAAERLILPISEGPLVALDPETGETDWRVESWAGRYLSHLSADDATLVSVARGRDEAIIAARDLETGDRRWRRRISGRSQRAVRADGVLTLATTTSVYGVGLDQAETE